jgi:hypothetical protein
VGEKWPWRGKEDLRWRIEADTEGKRAQEGEVCKRRVRNGNDVESFLGFGISSLFIVEVAVGAHNGPLSRTEIFGREEE